MKHLLNDLSEEEKNRIREQHTGGKKLVIENFDKLVNTKLGDAKPLLNEEDVPKSCSGEVYILPGQNKVVGRKEVIDWFNKETRSPVVAMQMCDGDGNMIPCGCRYDNKTLECFKD
jgi:hypothetical protein